MSKTGSVTFTTMIDHCTFESIKAKNWFIGICTIIDEKCIELDDWIHGWCEIKLDWECILKAILLFKKKKTVVCFTLKNCFSKV